MESKKILSKLQGLETGFGESVNAVPERTKEGSSVISKQFGTESAQGLERVFAEFKYEATKFFGTVKTSLSELT